MNTNKYMKAYSSQTLAYMIGTIADRQKREFYYDGFVYLCKFFLFSAKEVLVPWLKSVSHYIQTVQSQFLTFRK